MSTLVARSHSPPTPPSTHDSPIQDDKPSAPKRIKLSARTPPPLGAEDVREGLRAWGDLMLPYGTGLHLAPMVRIGTLPTRLLSLQYGAQLVWGPEIVDKALIGCVRSVDPLTGVVAFAKPSSPDKPVFTCHPLELPRLIFQIGSASPALALEAAKLVAGDVSGIGLNCGCPKPFSTSGGMGARLLDDPDRLCSILRELCTVPVPIDVKIRLLPSQSSTLALVSKILETPVSCLTVHCRTPSMRSSEPALLERLKEVVDLVRATRPDLHVVANGDCWKHEDSERICDLTGVNSIMIARGAEANPSCFRSDGLLDPVQVVLPLYLRIAKAVGNPFHNTKYVLGAFNLAASPSPATKRERGEFKQGLNKAKSYEEAENVLGINSELTNCAELEDLVPLWVERRKAMLSERTRRETKD